jgi:AcrR family transcriptional regulator
MINYNYTTIVNIVHSEVVMEKADIKARNKKTKILNNSTRLFKDYDIKKVTMDDIANLSNVSKMTVYKYFNDKDSLYKHVAEALLDLCYNNLKAQLNPDINVIQKMIGVNSVLVNFISEGNLSLCFKLGHLNEEVKLLLERFNERTKSILIDIVREGKSQKLIYEDINDEYFFHYIDMGLSYFQNNLEYRKKIMSEPVFRQEFMSFLWKNVFINQSHFST